MASLKTTLHPVERAERTISASPGQLAGRCSRRCLSASRQCSSVRSTSAAPSREPAGVSMDCRTGNEAARRAGAGRGRREHAAAARLRLGEALTQVPSLARGFSRGLMSGKRKEARNDFGGVSRRALILPSVWRSRRQSAGICPLDSRDFILCEECSRVAPALHRPRAGSRRSRDASASRYPRSVNAVS